MLGSDAHLLLGPYKSSLGSYRNLIRRTLEVFYTVIGSDNSSMEIV